MAELKDFGTVKTWYEAYKSVKEAEDKKPEDEKEDEKKKKSPVEVLPKDGGDEEQEEKKEEKPEQSGEVEKLKAEIEKLKGELQAKDLEVKKKDAETTVEPNPTPNTKERIANNLGNENSRPSEKSKNTMPTSASRCISSGWANTDNSCGPASTPANR